MRWLAAVALITLLPALPAFAQGDPVSGAINRVAARVQELSAIKGKKVGIYEFEMSGGTRTELGLFVADQLDVALTGRASAGGFEVLGRGQICQVIRENKLLVDDRWDPALQSKLGRFGHADFLVAGRLTSLGKEVALTVRLVDTETLRQIWADSLRFPLDEGLKGLVSRPISGDGCDVMAASAVTAAPPSTPTPSPASGDKLQARVWTDKPLYRIGESIRFGLRVNRDAYVTLINIGTSGDVTIIYPNRFHPNHFLRGGQDVIIPAPDAGFTLTVQGPPGFDQVRAIVTEEPVQLRVDDVGRAGEAGSPKVAFRSLDRAQTRNLAVDLKTARERLGSGRWAEEVIAVEVKQ